MKAVILKNTSIFKAYFCVVHLKAITFLKCFIHGDLRQINCTSTQKLCVLFSVYQIQYCIKKGIFLANYGPHKAYFDEIIGLNCFKCYYSICDIF